MPRRAVHGPQHLLRFTIRARSVPQEFDKRDHGSDVNQSRSHAHADHPFERVLVGLGDGPQQVRLGDGQIVFRCKVRQVQGARLLLPGMITDLIEHNEPSWAGSNIAVEIVAVGRERIDIPPAAAA